MEDNKKKKIEEFNSQVNEENEENLATSDDEKVTIEDGTVVKNTVDADEKSLQEESKIEATISALEEKVDDSKKLTIKVDSKVLFVMGVILVIIGTVLEIGMYVYENINKFDESKDTVKEESKEDEKSVSNPLSNEEIMEQIGLAAEALVQNDMEITEIIDELKEKYDFNCKTFEVGNGIIYLDKCSINGSDAIYSYSKVYENENIAQKCLNTVCESKIQTGSMYEEKELLLLAKPQYGVKGVYSNNTFDIGVLDCKDVKAYVEVVDNDAYIIFEDQKIKIDSVRNVKQAIANTYDDCGQPTIEIYLLTTDGSIFSSSYTFEYTEECGANKPESINEMIALVKKKDDNFKKKDTINKYDELSFINEKESGPTCAKKVYLTGKKDDVEYIIDNVEKKLTEHYSYTFYREDWWDTGEYYIDLDGKFFIVEESKKKEINIQPIYIFHVYGDNDSCDYLITQDSTLYSICSFNKLQKVKAEKVVKVIYYEGTSAPDSVIYFADGTKLTFSGYLVEDITKSS